MSAGPRVVGLDLSIAASGICGIDGECITVGGKPADGDHRIAWIVEAVVDEARHGFHADRWREPVDLVAVEGLAVHGRGHGMAAAQVMGAVKVALLNLGVPYVEVPPSTLKKYATGKGNADKTAMAIAALKRAGREFDDDNQCDAFLLRAAGMHALGHPVFEVPKAQSDALAKVKWPCETIYDGVDK